MRGRRVGAVSDNKPNRYGTYLHFCGDCNSVDDIEEGHCNSCDSSEEVSTWVPIEQCDRLRLAIREAMNQIPDNYEAHKTLKKALGE